MIALSERSDVYRVEAHVASDGRDDSFGVEIVAREEDGRSDPPDLGRSEKLSEDVIPSLYHSCLGQLPLYDLAARAAPQCFTIFAVGGPRYPLQRLRRDR